MLVYSCDCSFLPSTVIQKTAGRLYIFLFCLTLQKSDLLQGYRPLVLLAGADKEGGQSAQSICEENQKSVSRMICCIERIVSMIMPVILVSFFIVLLEV